MSHNNILGMFVAIVLKWKIGGQSHLIFYISNILCIVEHYINEDILSVLPFLRREWRNKAMTNSVKLLAITAIEKRAATRRKFRITKPVLETIEFYFLF